MWIYVIFKLVLYSGWWDWFLRFFFRIFRRGFGFFFCDWFFFDGMVWRVLFVWEYKYFILISFFVEVLGCWNVGFRGFFWIVCDSWFIEIIEVYCKCGIVEFLFLRFEKFCFGFICRVFLGETFDSGYYWRWYL